MEPCAEIRRGWFEQRPSPHIGPCACGAKIHVEDRWLGPHAAVERGARPVPVPWIRDEPRGHGILLDVAERVQAMFRIHDRGEVTPLPVVAGRPAGGVQPFRVLAMPIRDPLRQRLRGGRDDDEVHMVRHQHERGDLYTGLQLPSPHDADVDGALLVGLQDRQSVVAAVREVVWLARNDLSRNSSHACSMGVSAVAPPTRGGSSREIRTRLHMHHLRLRKWCICNRVRIYCWLTAMKNSGFDGSSAKTPRKWPLRASYLRICFVSRLPT